MTEAFIKAVIGVVVTASWGFCVWLVKRAKYSTNKILRQYTVNGVTV